MSRGSELKQMSSAVSNAGGRRGPNKRVVKDAVRYKTVLCTNWTAEGKCPYGPKCQFAHGPDELRVRSDAKREQSRATSPVPEPSAAAPSSSETCLPCRPPAAGLPWTTVVGQPASIASPATPPTSPTAASMPLPATLPQALPQAATPQASQPLPSLLPLLPSALPPFAGFAEAASAPPQQPVPPLSLLPPAALGLPAPTPLLSAAQVPVSPVYPASYPASTASSPVHAAAPSPAQLTMYAASAGSSPVHSAAPSPVPSLFFGGGGLMPPGLAPPSMSPRSSELSQPPQLTQLTQLSQLSVQPPPQQVQPQQQVRQQQVQQPQAKQQLQQQALGAELSVHRPPKAFPTDNPLYDCALFDSLCDRSRLSSSHRDSRRDSWLSIEQSDDSGRFELDEGFSKNPFASDPMLHCNTKTGSIEIIGVPLGKQASHNTGIIRRCVSEMFNEP